MKKENSTTYSYGGGIKKVVTNYKNGEVGISDYGKDGKIISYEIKTKAQVEAYERGTVYIYKSEDAENKKRDKIIDKVINLAEENKEKLINVQIDNAYEDETEITLTFKKITE